MTKRMLVSFAAACAAECLFGAVTMTKVGEYDFSVDGCGGITYAGGDTFYVLRDHDPSDGKAKVYPLTLGYNAGTGAITSQTLGEPATPGSNADSEGIAFDPGAGTLWISDEATPTIREFYPYGMATTRAQAPVPNVQKTSKRDNRSLEALTISGDGLSMWTANEQALTCDGESSDGNTTVRTVVRLTKFTRLTVSGDWQPAGQWAYACDTCAGSTHAQSGLSGLCALPDGSLLALEREVSVSTSGRCRIYRVTPEELAKATDVSSIAALSGATYTAVNKGSALIDFNNDDESWLLEYNMIVYEGICLGPRLSDGSVAVYLVSDGGETKSVSIATAYTLPRLCALKLSGLDISTIDLSAPTSGDTASTVGSNYRYLNGATVSVTLDGEGVSPVAYTNRGARVADVSWSLSTSKRGGQGAEATFTVSGDDRLDWTVVSSVANTPIIADDSFEGYEVGTPAETLPGWTEAGNVIAETYPAPAVGFPMQRTTHTKVLAVEDGVSRDYDSTDGCRQQLDMMVRVVRTAGGCQPECAGCQSCIWFAGDGRCHVVHAAPDGSKTDSVVSETVYAQGDWVRLSMSFDYTGAKPGFTLRLNGAYCGEYACLGGKSKISGFDVTGETALDDVIFTDGEPAFEVAANASSTVPKGVTVSQTWLDRYGLAWNDTEGDADADGLKTWEEYLADSSPIDGTSVFAIADFKVIGNVVSIAFTGNLPRPDLLKVKWCAALGGAKSEVSGTVTTEDGVSVWRATVPAEARFFRAYLCD